MNEDFDRTSNGDSSILIVDDECSILNFMKAAFRRCGRRLLVASSGAAALTILGEHRSGIGLMITDVHMQHLNGLDLVERARKINPEIRIVVSSGAVNAAEQAKIHDLQVEAFLQKPFSISELVACVDQVLENQKAA